MIGKMVSVFLGFAIALLLIYTLINYLPSQSSFSIGNFLNSTQYNLTYPSTTIQQSSLPQSQAVAYVLSLINKDRMNYSLANVTLSQITSGQQHAESMLQNNYFSHWDIYGMKPYMRYTLLGGNGSVDENVAWEFNSAGINVIDALKQMEFNMMYRDQAEHNGHRDNILTGHHNQVSIGVAYNATTVYLVEDFIDSHISWFYDTPSYNNGTVKLQGTVAQNYSLSKNYGVQILYDPMITNLTPQQLHNAPYNGSYGYGNVTAGISYTSGGVSYSFKNFININATEYQVQGQNFNIAFNMSKLIAQDGPGEYTVVVFLANGTNPNSNNVFYGATYTIFINSNGQRYIPNNV
jgi:uncharacterized protein YkwD